MNASHLIVIIAAISATFATVSGQTSSLWERPVDLCWSVSDNSISSFSPASDNQQTIFLTKTSSSFSSVNLHTGRLNWTVEAIGVPAGQPATDGMNVLAFSFTESLEKGREFNVFSISSASGISKLLEKISLSREFLMDSGEGFAVVTLPGGRLALIDLENGTRLVFSGLNEPSGLSAGTHGFLVWDKANAVRLFEMPSGALVATFQLPKPPSGSFSLDRERIYIGMSDGSLAAIRRTDGSVLWTARMGGAVEGIETIGYGVLASSRDNFVYLLSNENGNRKWKRKLAGRIIGKAILDEDHAAFLTYGSNEVFVLRLTDGKLVNSIRVEEANYFVSRPIFVAGRLIVPHSSGIVAFGPEGQCKQEKGS